MPPLKPFLARTRIRASGSAVDPALYARIGGAPVRLDPGTSEGRGHPALKVAVNSTAYRSAPATEFRNAIGISSSVGTIGNISDASRPAPPGSGLSSFRAFHCAEMQYMGIRQLRTTPQHTQPSAMQFARDWANTQVGTEFGRLMCEVGDLQNAESGNKPRCSGVFDSIGNGTIDFKFGKFLQDPDIRRSINMVEMLNEPNGFQKYLRAPPGSPFGADEVLKGTDGRTWLQCLGEYNKKIWNNYIVGDSRCAGMFTVASCPTSNYMIDSEWANDVPDGHDVASQWGSVEQYTDFGNDHPYCGHTRPGPSLAANLNYPYQPVFSHWAGMMRGHGAWPTRRLISSEFGYVVTRPQVSGWWSLLPNFEIYAIYFLKTFLEIFIRGWERLYWFNIFPMGRPLPRSGGQVGAEDDYSVYNWNTASPRYWWLRTQATHAMHRFTTTIGDGTAAPNVSFSVPSPHSSLRWLMLRNTTNHVLIVWRDVEMVQQPGVPLSEDDTSKPPAQPITVAPISARFNIPSATQVVETHPIDGAADVTLTINGSGSSRGVDVVLAQKPFMLVIE